MTEEQAIEQAEYDREHPETDPITELHHEIVQNRYETFCLGWHRD